MKVRISDLLLFLLLAQAAQAWETGDIIFHQSTSEQSKVIQQVTRSRYSHMGLIVSENGRTYVLEAIHHVTLTPIEDFIARGVDGHYVVKRLVPQARPGQQEWQKMRALAKDWMGLEYDLVFGWSDQRMYCSELVWKLYKRGAGIRIGEPVKFQDLDLSNQATQSLIRRRTNSLNLSEWIITPQAMFASDQLVRVGGR